MISVAISSFDRPRPLYWGLRSIADHPPKLNFELIVVNDGRADDGTEAICKEFQGRLPLKYVFTGQRHPKDKLIKRNPATTNNIAVHSCSGDKIVLSCAEMYHFGDSITAMDSLLSRKDVLGTPAYVYMDVKGEFLKSLEDGHPDQAKLKRTKNGPPFKGTPHDYDYYNFYPFFMGLRRVRFDRIGGYDEDFTEGYGHEDVDLMMRMIADGGIIEAIQTGTAHLYHGPRVTDIDATLVPGFSRNWDMYNNRRGQIVRNKH
jgi:glycosyltransferase involved in cell wall biosynthesis